MKSWKKNRMLAGMRECWTGRRLLESWRANLSKNFEKGGRAISKFCMEFY